MAIRRFTRCVGALAISGAVLASTSCGEVARSGQSPAYLIVMAVEGAAGATPEEFGTTLSSDVLTLVKKTIDGQEVFVPTIFSDTGRVSFSLGLKNQGLPTGSLGPSTLNTITINRFRVVYRRADGRNTPGVDVPHPFDGAITVTVGEGTTTTGFDLVRLQAKMESPLANMVSNGGSIVISTIAEITFYGQDQAGNQVMATANMSINFSDWGDPD